jgi:hypothetical protein
MSNRRNPRGTATKPSAALAASPANAYWNGLPTTAERGTAVVADAPEFPAYWAKTEGIIGQRIAVVRVVLDGVNYGGGVAYLDDRDGSGWRKVTTGHGSPSYGHADVAIEEGSFR